MEVTDDRGFSVKAPEEGLVSLPGGCLVGLLFIAFGEEEGGVCLSLWGQQLVRYQFQDFFFAGEHGRAKLQSTGMSLVALQSSIFPVVGAVGRSASALVPVISVCRGHIKCAGSFLRCFCKQTRIVLWICKSQTPS